MVSQSELAARGYAAKRNFLIGKNSEAPAGQHWDLSVGDYVVDDSCDEGYHWDAEKYDCVPD